MIYETLKSKVDRRLAEAQFDLARCSDSYRIAHILTNLRHDIQVLEKDANDTVRELEDISGDI